MKNSIIKIVSWVLQSIDKMLVALHLKTPQVVIYMDGGICSQMLMYLQGRYYAEKGINVYYDTYWFDVCGKDQYGKHPRVFELIEMWPNIEFKTISRFKRKIFFLFFKAERKNADWLPEPKSVKRSMYLNSYWDMPSEAHKSLFSKYFDLKTASIPIKYNNKIVGGNGLIINALACM